MDTPKKIYEKYCTKSIDKDSAIDTLVSIIENSDNNTNRVDSINILGEMSVKTKEVFSLLENLLISDSNERVRNAAAEVLNNTFDKEALEPMKWALEHEDSKVCLQTIYNTIITIIKNLANQSNSDSKSILEQEIQKINEKEFKIGFEILFENKPIEDFTKLELADFLQNYFSISYLTKIYWRLKYIIKKCKVVELDFIFKGLTKIPEAVRNLTSLEVLILRYNQLNGIPDWINTLKSLRILNLNVNNIKNLPETIGELSSLKELYLWKNELMYLPNSIGSLSSLEILNLRLNQLVALPNSIGNLSVLKELNLHDNKLMYPPSTIGSLKSLETLNLSWNILRDIPNSIGALSTLKVLNLERNELTTVPESIGSLKNLRSLNLSENNLEVLPDSLNSLESLEILNLSRNQLIDLPESLGNLTSLKELYLGENKKPLKLPKSLKSLEEKGLKIYRYYSSY